MRVIGIILLCSAMLVNDIKNKNVELLYFLPFSKRELFLYNLMFLVLIISITSAVDKIYYKPDHFRRVISYFKNNHCAFSNLRDKYVIRDIRT